MIYKKRVLVAASGLDPSCFQQGAESPSRDSENIHFGKGDWLTVYSHRPPPQPTYHNLFIAHILVYEVYEFTRFTSRHLGKE